ncbi:MAG: tetratricopeptide repeat protein, partial [Planctomycetota bacterium]
LHTEILYEKSANEHAKSLASITQLWRILDKPDRAEQTLNKLATTYPRSQWLKKAQPAAKP